MAFNREQTREYWTQQAKTHGQAVAASWSDQSAVELEIKEIAKHLRDGDNVLDAGCANGYSTLQFAQRKRLRIRGIDYIPEMITEARARLSQSQTESVVEFQTGDITSLTESDEAYDRLIVIRVICNLGNEARQQTALRECARVLKRGGLLLMSEPTLQGWQRTNSLRREWGLSDIPMPPFNQYVDEDAVPRMTAAFKLVELAHFSSTYFVGTRLVKPLLIKLLGGDLDASDPDMEWNRWCSQLPAWGDYGTQKLFVMEKL
jgi:ubiquinone/menaquinone biosynthesis C-methylase UbiE